MLRKIVLLVVSLLISLPVLANTNTFIVKSFAVANINTNSGTGNLVGTVTIENTNNTPFFIVSNATLNVASGQTQQVYVGFYTTGFPYAFYTNRLIFTSNGGNSTNVVSGKIVPKAPAQLNMN